MLSLRRASSLEQRPIAQFLIVTSVGLLEDVSRLLNATAEQAIRDGSERIKLRQLEQAAYAHT